MTTRIVVTLVSCAVCCVAGAEPQAAPSAKFTPGNLRIAAAKATPIPKSNGPTLEYTMEYIQEKLIGRGVLDYQVALHDSLAGKDWSYEFTDKLSGTYANPSTCQIGFHWKQTRSGKVVTDKETYVDLNTGVKLDVLPLDQYLTESAAKSGHDTWSTKASPSLVVLRITKPDNRDSNFVFPDEDTATHLAKALVHAAELCAKAQETVTPAGGKDAF
jgi:hypothetical protein